MAAADPPVVVVTATSNGERSGCLVGFHTQCSIEPPRYAVMLSKANHTYEVAEGASELAVNLLGAGQIDLARLFGEETADDGVDKFQQCSWEPGTSGVPLLHGSLAWIVGEVIDRHDLGDHVLHLLRPISVTRHSVGDPALRFGDVSALDPGHPG